jgi:hypothetical protein
MSHQSQAGKQQGTKGKEARGAGADAAELRQAEAWIIGACLWIACCAGMVPATEPFVAKCWGPWVEIV